MQEHFTGAHEVPSPDADARALWRWFRKLSFLTQSVSIRRNSVSGWHTGLIFKFVPAGKGPVSWLCRVSSQAPKNIEQSTELREFMSQRPSRARDEDTFDDVCLSVTMGMEEGQLTTSIVVKGREKEIGQRQNNGERDRARQRDTGRTRPKGQTNRQKDRAHGQKEREREKYCFFAGSH